MFHAGLTAQTYWIEFSEIRLRSLPANSPTVFIQIIQPFVVGPVLLAA